MIQMPRRSVTRFFIPLIDVLTLLFCTFLLLPMLKSPAAEEPESPALSREDQINLLKREIITLTKESRDRPKQLREEIERLRQEKVKVLQDRLVIRILEIDGNNGQLLYRDRIHPQGVPLTSELDMQKLIDEDRLRLGSGNRDLFYLIVYPKLDSRFPSEQDAAKYESWLKEVAHGTELPGRGTASGGMPP